MKQKKFVILLLLICLLGLILRLIDYDKTPAWRQSDDEIHYAWAGISWLQTGIPKSWSWLSSYPTNETLYAWGSQWRLVSPMLEKPPLYIFLSGTTALVAGQNEFHEIRLTTIRLLPIVLSVVTIGLLGIVTATVFSQSTGLLAALLYAIVPTIVLSNRLSVTENLLTTLMLGAAWFLLNKPKQIIFIALIAGLAALTKQSGLSTILAVVAVYAYQKNLRAVIISALIGIGMYSIYPLIGFFYDSQLFLGLTQEARRIGIQGGLPQLVFSIISRPLITTEKLFLDGTMLLGYILLFMSPYSFLDQLPDRKQRNSLISLLIFPFSYLLYLMVFISAAEPIGTGQGFWGWYNYPLFPFLMVFVAALLMRIWQLLSLIQLLPVIAILGSSTIRFVFLFLPQSIWYRWQYVMILLFLTPIAFHFLSKTNKQRLLLVLFFIFMTVNLFTSFNLSSIYTSFPQPN